MNFIITKITSYKFRLEHMVIPLFLVFVFFLKPFLEDNKALFLVEKSQKETTRSHKNNARANKAPPTNSSQNEFFQTNNTEQQNTEEQNGENLVVISATQQANQIAEVLEQENEANNEELDQISSIFNHDLASDLSAPIKVINFASYSMDTEFEKWLIKDNQAEVDLANHKDILSKDLEFHVFSGLYEKNHNEPSIKKDPEENNDKKQINLRIDYGWLTKYSMANENTFFDYDMYLDPIQIDFNNPIN